MHARVLSGAVLGIDAYLVQVEADAAAEIDAPEGLRSTLGIRCSWSFVRLPGGWIVAVSGGSTPRAPCPGAACPDTLLLDRAAVPVPEDVMGGNRSSSPSRAKNGSRRTGVEGSPPPPSLERIRDEMRSLADPIRAEVSARYFKTGPGQYGEGDRFLGLRVPQIRRLARGWRDLDHRAVRELLCSPWHEERLLALLILVDQYRRGSDAAREAIFRTYLANTRCVNSWDLVDASAEYIVGAHLDPRDLTVLERLARSGSVWERRIAILATFRWIRQGDVEPSLHLARLLLHDPHDLIHKAAGWLLREVGKRERAREEDFLRAHYTSMPRTMLRYAIEHLPEARRQQYLRGEV